MIPAILGIAFGLGFPLAFAVSVRRADQQSVLDRQGMVDRRGVADRRGVVEGFVTALLGVFLAWLWVPWDVVPPLLWALPVAVTTYGVLRAASVWPRLPWITGPRRALKATGTVAGVAVTALLYLLALA